MDVIVCLGVQTRLLLRIVRAPVSVQVDEVIYVLALWLELPRLPHGEIGKG